MNNTYIAVINLKDSPYMESKIGKNIFPSIQWLSNRDHRLELCVNITTAHGTMRAFSYFKIVLSNVLRC